ncbi:hypothetical protein BC567DRAFT_238080 [Phyllosticta citribraziliensis]
MNSRCARCSCLSRPPDSNDVASFAEITIIEEEEEEDIPPIPIKRAPISGQTGRILSRSFGGSRPIGRQRRRRRAIQLAIQPHRQTEPQCLNQRERRPKVLPCTPFRKKKEKKSQRCHLLQGPSRANEAVPSSLRFLPSRKGGAIKENHRHGCLLRGRSHPLDVKRQSQCSQPPVVGRTLVETRPGSPAAASPSKGMTGHGGAGR